MRTRTLVLLLALAVAGLLWVLRPATDPVMAAFVMAIAAFLVASVLVLTRTVRNAVGG